MIFSKEQAKRQIRRLRVREPEFTVISNNCWGAHIYQTLGLSYQTPFVGLFLMPECYLNLLSDFRKAVVKPLKFKDTSRHEYVRAFRAESHLSYPIGYLDEGIEIQFMHEEDNAQAADKWARRVQRITKNDDRLFLKFDEKDLPTRGHLEEFDRLPFRHKVCFVAHPDVALQSAVCIPGCTERFPDGQVLSGLSRDHFDVIDWINGGAGRTHWPSALRA